MWEDNREWVFFSLEEALLWIMDLNFGQMNGLKSKWHNDGFASYKHTAFHFILMAPIDYRWSIDEQVM